MRTSALDDLIERHGIGAIVTIQPYVGESGETLRWFALVDGKDVPELDVRLIENDTRCVPVSRYRSR